MAPQSDFGDAKEINAQPVNLLGPFVDGDTTTPGAEQRDGIVIVVPGAGGSTPVSALNPLPVTAVGGGGGDASAANQTTQIAHEAAIETAVESIDTKTPALGQALMAASSPVVIASDQSAVPVSAASLPLPTGAATEATLAGLAAEDFATQTTLAALAAEDFATETTLAAAAVDIGSIESNTSQSASSLASIDPKIPALGQALMAASTPVVIASNQTAVPVSAASLPLPTGAATEATLAGLAAEDFATETTLAALNAKVTAVNTGAVVVSSSALPTGAATSANQTTELASLASIDGKIVKADTDNVTVIANALPTGAATLAEQQTQTTALGLLDDVPTAANGAFSKGAPAMGQFDDTTPTDATENNCMPMRITAKRALHVNLRDTTGTERGTATNAIVAGGRGAIATTPGGVTEGESVPLFCDSQGRLVVRPHSTPDKLTQNLITLTSTTETTLIAAGGVTLFRDLTMLMFSNTSATGVRVDIRDATGGTVRLSFWLPGGVSTGNLVESSIWKQTTANNNWTAQLSAAVTDVRVMAQGVERVTPTF